MTYFYLGIFQILSDQLQERLEQESLIKQLQKEKKEAEIRVHKLDLNSTF